MIGGVSGIHQPLWPLQLIAYIPQAHERKACHLPLEILCQIKVLFIYGKEVAAHYLPGQILPSGETDFLPALRHQQAVLPDADDGIGGSADLLRMIFVVQLVGGDILYHESFSFLRKISYKGCFT